MKNLKTQLHQLRDCKNSQSYFVSWKRYFLLVTIFFLSASETSAGWISGRNVVWVNLDKSPDGAQVDRMIASFVDKESTKCDGNWSVSNSWLYMKRRPPKITDALVADIFKSRNPSKIKVLHEALKNYKDDYLDDGFDGIIVYSNAGEGQMMSMTTGRKKVERFTVSLKGKAPRNEMIESAFCVLLPPVARLP